MLKKLILSIMNSNFDILLLNNVKIIIMDNDSAHSAEKSVLELIEGNKSPVNIEYHFYPNKGLSNVRNELLRRCMELCTDFIVFIDDDEFVSDDWLNELLTTIIKNNGDMAMGPVIQVFEKRVSKYISCWFERPIYRDNSIVKTIATNNLIIKTDSLIKKQIWFDNRFNKTGAEDTYFGLQMLKKGSIAYWSSNAIVYETIPESRANIVWLIRRFFNGANTYTYILKLENSYFKLFKKTLINLIYIFSGICATIIIPLPIKKKYWGLLKFFEGIGGIAGLLSIQYYEYK